MNWRETLGVAEATGVPHAHNPQNAQKTAMSGNSADSADSASPDAGETASKLLEALADACRDLPITPAAVRDALAPEDIEDWRKGEITRDTLAAFARSLVQRREMDRGERPAHYTERATCKHCGPIWLWFSGEVLGCPWCWNRVSDRPIPRLHAGRCKDCTHFRRTDHPHRGHYPKGEPEAIAGLWDTDRRYCERYLPHSETGDNDESAEDEYLTKE
ncbi:MAG: hypothetical protein FKY71_07480 [Spiribacter salinus]|uniref:Uncharacterized protein n=1 Tax=Spiribacter salinus TaxID=1335746 RepID=A0A540VS97_9GAMM|nr:MAG: hypothetical protein FKY71_07480 [Spiribacter salinus]